MTTNPRSATAEGMPNRRQFLTTGALAATATVIPAAAIAAEAAGETLLDRMERLAEEMGTALDEWIDHSAAPGYPRPRWDAVIAPASLGPGYHLLHRRRETPALKVQRLAKELAEAIADSNEADAAAGIDDDIWCVHVFPKGFIDYPVTVEYAGIRQRPIEKLFAEWKQVRDLPAGDPSSDADDYRRYEELQDAMLKVRPVTARDLAMQFVADTHFMGSDCSDQFEAIVDSLIGAAVQS